MKLGELVVIVLTGQVGMIIEIYDNMGFIEGFRKGYLVRLPDYSTRKFFAEELKERR